MTNTTDKINKLNAALGNQPQPNSTNTNIKCEHCGAINHQHRTKCYYCGAPLPLYVYHEECWNQEVRDWEANKE